MAVPKEVNSFVEEDDVNALFEYNAVEYEDYPEFDLLLADFAAAAKSGDVVALATAIDDMFGLVDEPLEDNNSALHLACLYGHLPCVELLIERDADMEVKAIDDAIPLHDACAGAGYLDIVEFLLSRASSPEVAKRMIGTTDERGETPLHNAARGHYDDVISFLLSSGASPTVKNVNGKTPGDLAGIDSDARRILEAAVSNSRIS
ncbi:hypothetical protein Bca52824_067182 [Brassica carinata]|uniref:Uncharacterized protein n=1 Tax=Brassica carinata TaxID=52824 RepID=A0A8X7UBI2_BRACI|nr:hypothetical protein Bca52824_067182 [Brassica carinata]